MPKLSLYRPTKTNDYRFFDNTIRNMFTVGGLDVLIHKYLGPLTDDNSGNFDATTPAYPTSQPTFIEDLLLLENRDRKYEDSVFVMRAVYQESDQDFDLTQFGLFLSGDTKFLTVHYNDMIDIFGRKIMSGDVIEFPNLKDYHPLDTTIMKGLPRYYVVQDANWASEGFSQTWLPHLWRLKCSPMVNAQEYHDILNKPFEPNNIWDPGNFYPAGMTVQDGDTYYRSKTDVPPGTPITDPASWEPITNPTTIADKDSTRNKDLEINDAILLQAKVEVPLSGFDTSAFYVLPTTADGQPALSENTAVSYSVTADSVLVSKDGLIMTPGVYYTIAYPGADSNTGTLSLSIAPTADAILQTRYLNRSDASNITSQLIMPDGTTRRFTLTHAVPQSSILVIANGRTLKADLDYLVSGDVLELKGTPSASVVLEVLYLNLKNPAGVLQQLLAARSDNYTLNYSASAVDLLVFVNGMLLIPEVDYWVDDTLISFKTLPRSTVDVRFILDPQTNTSPITVHTITVLPGSASYPVNNVGNSVTPRGPGYTGGYLASVNYDGGGNPIGLNGLPVTEWPLPEGSIPVTPGTQFPPNPAVGAYCLRLDYFPNRLFRFNGRAWVKIEEGVRTDMYLNEGANTQRSSFVNNRYTVPTSDQGNIPSRQSLDQALEPFADNGNQGGNKPAAPPPLTAPGQKTFPGQP